MPESLKEIEIDYPTGFRASAGCSADVVSIAVPAQTDPPLKAGCPAVGGNAARSTVENVLERAGRWLHDATH